MAYHRLHNREVCRVYLWTMVKMITLSIFSCTVLPLWALAAAMTPGAGAASQAHPRSSIGVRDEAPHGVVMEEIANNGIRIASGVAEGDAARAAHGGGQDVSPGEHGNRLERA